MKNPLDNNEVGAGQSDFEKAAHALIATIPRDKLNQRSGWVLNYLAENAIRRRAQCSDETAVSQKDLHTDFHTTKKTTCNTEPSQWFSAVWKPLTVQLYEPIKDELMAKCRAAGLTTYPVICRRKPPGETNAYLFIELQDLPAAELAEVDAMKVDDDIPGDAIRYDRPMNLRRSRLGQWLVGTGITWSRWKRFLMVTWMIGLIVIAAIVVIGLWLGLSRHSSPLSSQDVIYFAVMIGTPLAVIRLISNVGSVFVDRITIASDWMLQWDEEGATIEVVRSSDPDEPSQILVRRYAARCPICNNGTSIILSEGAPDFPFRIVGRCQDAPREHVFSFDHVTKSGAPLRQPPIRLQRGDDDIYREEIPPTVPVAP